jgi:hypothetical protein
MDHAACSGILIVVVVAIVVVVMDQRAVTIS